MTRAARAPLERDQTRPEKHDCTDIGPVDIALWDLRGKHHDVPIYEPLGTYTKRLPTTPAPASSTIGRGSRRTRSGA